MNPYTPWGALAISILTLLYTIWRNHGSEIASLKERVTTLETKIAVFWQNVTLDMGRVLHSPHPENARLDHLLEQLEAETITVDELKELIRELKRRKDARQAPNAEQLAASLMLRAMQQRDGDAIFARALAEVEH